MSGRIRLGEVKYCSAEHPKNSARNLADGKGRWTCPGALFRPAGQAKPQQIEAEFMFRSPTLVTGLDIGNFWSASLEVSVGRAGWDTGQKEVLLPKFELMNRNQCFSGENKEKVILAREEHMKKEIAAQKWDSIKIVCNQPHKFNNEVYGLSMFVLHGQEDRKEVDNKENRGVELPGTKVVKAGLQELEKKLDRAAPSKHQPKLSTTLQSLENSTRVNTEGRELGMRLESAATSRSAKLVAKALGPNNTEIRKAEPVVNNVEDPLKKECLEFLHSCGFEELNFVEIEAVTFRKLKDLWREKKRKVMTVEQKECLKPLSVKFLSKLLSRTQKRVLEDKEDAPNKRRKVSEKVLEMRKEDTMADEVAGEGGMRRNLLATRDKFCNTSTSHSSERSKVNIIQPNSKSGPTTSTPNSKTSKGMFKTPEYVLDRSFEDVSKEKRADKVINVVQQLEGKATFDLGEIEIEDSPPEVEVMRVKKAGKKRIEVEAPVHDIEVLQEEVAREDTGIVESSPVARARVPTYRRKELQNFTQRALVKAGILVQVYNYKKAKELPLRGGRILKVEAQQKVTFYKVGPDIHLETLGEFHLPDVQPEHRQRLFKNFPAARVDDMSYPTSLEDFFAKKEGLLIKSPGPSTSKEKEAKKSEKKKTPRKRESLEVKQGLESRASSPVLRSASPCTSCPLCSRSFPLEELEEHAARCSGVEEEEESTANCPICNLELEVEALEEHAATCAAAMFGS